MKKRYGYLIFAYGIGLSVLFGFFLVIDYAALIVAVSQKKEDIELRHRLNVFAEGVWFLLANVIAIYGLNMILSRSEPPS